jgi:putative spermidine/putrescine transport system substrate-binding protein
MFMKLTKTLLATTALTVAAGASATAQEMADSMTLVSRGGAYQASQQKALPRPWPRCAP